MIVQWQLRHVLQVISFRPEDSDEGEEEHRQEDEHRDDDQGIRMTFEANASKHLD